MKIIGITGGAGSGKSSVCRILKDIGACIIDADMIARKVVKHGSKGLEELVKCFGDEILMHDGSLDRGKLRGVVFKDSKKLEDLNQITHKYIREEIYSSIDLIKNKNENVLIAIDAAIPFEKGFMDVVEEVWLVTSEKDIRVERIVKRSNYSNEEAVAVIDSQKSDIEYSKIADRIIENNNSIEHLKQNVVKLLYG